MHKSVTIKIIHRGGGNGDEIRTIKKCSLCQRQKGQDNVCS